MLLGSAINFQAETILFQGIPQPMTAQQGHQGLAISAYSSKSNLCSRAPHWVGWSSVISASQSEALLPQTCFLLLSLRCHQSLHHSLKVIPLLLLPPNKPLAFPTLCQGLLTLGLTQTISSISSKFNATRADTAKYKCSFGNNLFITSTTLRGGLQGERQQGFI